MSAMSELDIERQELAGRIWRAADPVMLPDVLTRADVRVNRRTGFVEARADGGYIVGLVSRDQNAAGAPIWRATACDIGSFAFTREGAVSRVLDLWNLTEKARAYDLMTVRVKGR